MEANPKQVDIDGTEVDDDDESSSLFGGGSSDEELDTGTQVPRADERGNVEKAISKVPEKIQEAPRSKASNSPPPTRAEVQKRVAEQVRS